MSNLQPCPECNHSVAPSATNCPNCGANLEEEPGISFHIVRVIITLAVILVLGRVLMYLNRCDEAVLTEPYPLEERTWQNVQVAIKILTI